MRLLRPRPLLAALVVVGVLAPGPADASPAIARSPARAGGCRGWLAPVDGPITNPFRAPAFAYGPGHRGVDFAAGPGTPARAAGDGRVVFAGAVAGSLHVVVGHEGGLRTTYAFLAATAVHDGEPVRRGQVVGTAGGSGPEHEPGVLHFGLRLGDEYVDPALLFSMCDLTDLVRLVPTDQPSGQPWAGARGTPVARHRGGVVDDLTGALGDAWDAASAFPGAAGSVVGGAASSAWDAVQVSGEAALQLSRDYARLERALTRELARATLDALRSTPQGSAIGALADVSSRMIDWWHSRRDCSDASPPADGTGGSGHLLMAVAGISSSGAPDDPTFSLDTDALGYERDEVTYYSYAPDGGRYGPKQTFGDLDAAGRRLGEQLKRLQREHPGREVDLIAHSQGGVVIDVFLEKHYDPTDPSYPPIGTVVTLSSPHHGAPLATSTAEWNDSPLGRSVLDVAEDHAPFPPPDAPSVRQMDEDSSFMRHLWDHRLPDHIDFTTIGGNADVLVPATQIDVPGASEAVVDVGRLVDPFDDHSAIVSDPHALRVVRAALEGRAPPCIGIWEGLRGATAPVVVTRLEHGLGAVPGGSR